MKAPESNDSTPKHQKPTSGSSLIRQGSALSLLTLVSRVLGLGREMTKAAFLGTTALSDAFSVAFMIPNLFRRLFAEGSIAVAFIPTFKEYLAEHSGGKVTTEEIKEFLSCLFTFLTFVVTITVTVGIILSPFLIRVFGMEEFDETVFLTRLMFPFLIFISIAAFFQGILNSFKIFAPSGFAPILLNIAIILCAYALSPYMQNPARAMAVGVLIGGFSGAAIQLPFILKHKSKIRFFFTSIKKALNNPGTKKVLRLIGPTIIGMAAYQLNDLVSTALAGNAGEGVVSSLQFSLRLQELILGVFAVSIGTVLLPDLAEHAKSRQWDIYKQRLTSAMNIIAFIAIPVTFFALSQGETLIRLLFQTRYFGEESVALTLAAFTFHMPGLYFIALNRILAPAFYAQSDSKSPTIAGIISFVVNIILASILVSHFRGSGIAFALSFSSAVNTAVLLYFLRKNPSISLITMLRSTLGYSFKLILISAAAIIPLLFLSPFLTEVFYGNHRVISQGAPLLINAVVYSVTGIALLAATADKQFLAIVKMLKSRKKR
ncbi:MAG: murein biosynthesis integral membrane protein MurJ [Treponema sp.]|jgi:putative peptidoglycan lipid II flippase|nr:murein biosynthesis integral membrane protein MurJ [Treponema sp.]